MINILDLLHEVRDLCLNAIVTEDDDMAKAVEKLDIIIDHMEKN